MFATSSGVPPRRKGIFFAHSALTSSERAAVMSVRMNPGAIALARMPREPNSCAIDLANAIIPALEAA